MGLYLGIAFFLLILLTLGLWGLVVKSQTPKRVESTETPDIPYEDVVIPSGVHKLKGWFIPAKTEMDKSPLIIVVHGWGSGKSRMFRYLKPLHQSGYAILMFDVRSHGESDREKAPTVKMFRDDVIAAVQYACQREDVDQQRIGLLAHSFGGYGSILANTHKLGIQALVTDSMPTRIRTIIEASLSHYKLPYFPLGPLLFTLMFWRAGISRKELEQLQVGWAIDHQQSPVLMVHSKHDHYVPASDLQYLIDQHKVDGTRKSHLFVTSKGHRSSETDPQFWPQVLGFFSRHMG